MTQRTMLILAATLSVFGLVLVGGLATRLAVQTAAAPQPTATAAPTDLPTAQVGLDPTAVQALIAQRDQSYQQVIHEANERLQQTKAQLDQSYEKQRMLAAQLNQAYKQQTVAQQAPPARPRAQPHLQVQVQAPPQPTAAPEPTPVPAPTAPPAPTYAISPDMAAAIALGAVPGATLTRQPELVDFQGTVAYEVVLDRGNVYVDANSGQVLYNGAATTASSGGHGGEHDGGEHDSGGHDD
jgi:uncharacterized membrane protein YkoI